MSDILLEKTIRKWKGIILSKDSIPEFGIDLNDIKIDSDIVFSSLILPKLVDSPKDLILILRDNQHIQTFLDKLTKDIYLHQKIVVRSVLITDGSYDSNLTQKLRSNAIIIDQIDYLNWDQILTKALIGNYKKESTDPFEVNIITLFEYQINKISNDKEPIIQEVNDTLSLSNMI